MSSTLTWISNPDMVDVRSFISNLTGNITIESLNCGFLKYTINNIQITDKIRASLSNIAAQPLDISVAITGRETINDIKGLKNIAESIISDVLDIKINVRSILFNDMILYQIYLDDDLYYVHEEERKYIIENIDLSKYIGYRLVTNDPLGIYNAIEHSFVEIIGNLTVCKAQYNDSTEDFISQFLHDIDKLRREFYFEIEFNGINDISNRRLLRLLAPKYNVTFVAETNRYDFYVSNELPNRFLQIKNQTIMQNQLVK